MPETNNQIILFTSDATYHQDKTAKVYVDGICTAEELFTKSSIWSDVRCSEQTRYGILSVTHNATKIRCRMVFGTGVPVRNTLVVQCLFDVQPVCEYLIGVDIKNPKTIILFVLGRQLVICIQLAMQDVQNPSLQRFKNGYAATQLVLFFFQKQKKLPSVKSLQEGCNARIKCGGENIIHIGCIRCQNSIDHCFLLSNGRKRRGVPEAKEYTDLQRSFPAHFGFILQILHRIQFR